MYRGTQRKALSSLRREVLVFIFTARCSGWNEVATGVQTEWIEQSPETQLDVYRTQETIWRRGASDNTGTQLEIPDWCFFLWAPSLFLLEQGLEH